MQNEKMKKILMIMYSLDPGGIESFVVNLVEHFDMSLVQVDVCIFNKKEEEVAFYENRILAVGANVIKLWEGKNHYIGYFKRRKILWHYLKSCQYDTVHVHGGLADDALDCMVAYQCKVSQIIMHAHMSGLNLSQHTWIQLLIHYLARIMHIPNRFATDYFACSREAAKWMFGTKNLDNTKIIPNGIAVEKFLFSESVRQEYRNLLHLENEFVIGNVGRLSREKNQIFLLDILFDILKIEKNCRLLILGEGEERESLIKRAKELEIEEQVLIVDNRFDVKKCYQAMDVFVMPSFSEGFGIACVEAQISGMKCIVSDRLPKSTNITGNVEYLPLKCGANVWAKRVIKELGMPRCLLAAESLNDKTIRIDYSSYMVEEYYYGKNIS